MLQPVLLSLSFIQLAVAETNQAAELCEAQELQACHCWFYSPPCPGLKGSTCMTAWMMKRCSESVRTRRDERHYQCSSCQTWPQRDVQSLTKPGTSSFTEGLILLNEESDLTNRGSLLQGRREVMGANLYCFLPTWSSKLSNNFSCFCSQQNRSNLHCKETNKPWQRCSISVAQMRKRTPFQRGNNLLSVVLGMDLY